MKVMVTNAEYKHALAAIRSLGRRGIEVVSTSQFEHAQGFYSRYSKKRFVSPPPTTEAKYIKFIRSTAMKEKIDVILPVGFNSIYAISGCLEKLSDFKIPIPPREKVRAVSNKWEAMMLARKEGVPIPVTVLIENASDPDLKGLEHPVVVKGDEGSGFHSYCNTPSQTRLEIKKLKKLYFGNGNEHGSIIVQEYIFGKGYGHFSLLNHGAVKAFFQHKRLREFPISGGSATKAESILDKKLKRYGESMLRSLKWHGVAMVEFKKDERDNEFKLMEINPKFWGSLALSIRCGVDFPYLAAQMAYTGDIKKAGAYKTGVRYRWLFPDDTLHLLSNPKILPSYLCDCLNPGIGSDIQITDPLPTTIQFGNTILQLKRVREDRKRRLPDKRGESNK